MYNPFCLGDWKPLLRRLPAGQRGVALTYDDGPTPETTPRLLDLLDRFGATATFFLTGERCERDPELVAALVAAGHTIYGHGWKHHDFATDPEEALNQMRRVEELLARFRPTPDTYLIRLPYFAGYNRVSIHRALSKFHPNIHFCWWSHSIRDWELPEEAKDRLHFLQLCGNRVDRMLDDPELAGGIILLHEAPFGIVSPFNAEMAGVLLPLILNGLTKRGLRTVHIKPVEQTSLLRRCVLLPAD